jgi:hypothetical protein
MVGRIRDVVRSPERPERYLVKFSEYARIDYPNAWPGLRNPVRYATLEDFGIPSPDTLTWRPMPDNDSAVEPTPMAAPPDEDREGFGPLTIAEAKAGLALGLGVPEGAIEITIRY